MSRRETLSVGAGDRVLAHMAAQVAMIAVMAKWPAGKVHWWVDLDGQVRASVTLDGGAERVFEVAWDGLGDGANVQVRGLALEGKG